MKTNTLFIGNEGSYKLTALKNVIDRKLIIPSYQRPGAWNEDHIEDLFNAIKEGFGSEKGHIESDFRPAFFGSVIFEASAQNKYFIIDGKQQVTAFLLVLRIIQEKLLEIQGQNIEKMKALDCGLDEEAKRKDIIKMREIFGKQTEIEKENDKYTGLIGKILELLRKTEISRDTSDVKSEEHKIESEYIKYIKGEALKGPEDFEKNKNRISKRLEGIMENIEITSPDKFENYSRIVSYILNEVKFCLLNTELVSASSFRV